MFLESTKLKRKKTEICKNRSESWTGLHRDLLYCYCDTCKHVVTGQKIGIGVAELAANLQDKTSWMKAHIRANEWNAAEGCRWYNGYYDNHSRKSECYSEEQVRMMLTSQDVWLCLWSEGEWCGLCSYSGGVCPAFKAIDTLFRHCDDFETSRI